jgi:O-antigen biosynthesis protein
MSVAFHHGAAIAQRTGAEEKTYPDVRLRLDGKTFVRDGKPFHFKGITYGPFAPDVEGQPFPDSRCVADDFARMRAAGFNSLRTYHAPPGWLLRLAGEHDLAVFVDVPWPKHLCFLDSAQAQAEARRLVRQAIKQGCDLSCSLAYSIANEIPPSVVRWHGTRRIERFLRELADVARQEDPRALLTYANFPPTEYLDLSFLDFATFNVYLHDRETFRRYLFRLQNLVGDRPLVLGEIGMDTLRHGELVQADFLSGHVRETLLMGLAGAFVFSWTDEWFTGGCRIENWAFGVTHADRLPKASYHALREVLEQPNPAALLDKAPRVSVVVCTYNGGRTLDQCLRSLRALDYPDYEVIVVDDGSTDGTRDVLQCFPDVRAIHQENRGLSTARNVGLQAATGSIVAYTDSDCFADPDWLTHLVYQLEKSGADAVGGPNLTPEDGCLAACVGAAPGQPTHVLESDQVAEHVPGCNMAFRKEALEAINGFDPQYRKAGDDVDVCWRLQAAGKWITFAPGAFVWHHRRQGPRAYFKQQAGYGEAEALLYFKHPDKFNGMGNGKWRGVLYGASLQGLRLGGPIVYRGTFGAGLFQCVYQPGPAHWAMLPSTLEWHVGTALVAVLALLWPPAWLGVAALLALSVLVAVLQAAQAKIASEHDGFGARCLVAVLCYLQPLIRSWSRYRTRLSAFWATAARPPLEGGPFRRLPPSGRLMVNYWSEEWRERTELLDRAVAYLNGNCWGKVIDSGWSAWDLRIYFSPWTVVEVCTVQEDHGSGKRLIRAGFRLRPSNYLKAVVGVGLVAAAGAGLFSSWILIAESVALLGACLVLWRRATYRAAQVVGIFDALGREMCLIRCDPAAEAAVAEAPAPVLSGVEYRQGIPASVNGTGLPAAAPGEMV